MPIELSCSQANLALIMSLTHWGRVTQICVSKLAIIVSDNGLPPGQRQAIIWTNTAILLIEPLGTNFSEILIEIHTFSFKKNTFENVVWKWWPFCPGLNVLMSMKMRLNLAPMQYCLRTFPAIAVLQAL